MAKEKTKCGQWSLVTGTLAVALIAKQACYRVIMLMINQNYEFDTVRNYDHTLISRQMYNAKTMYKLSETKNYLKQKYIFILLANPTNQNTSIHT